MSVRVEMRWPDELAAQVKLAASEAGLSRTEYVLWALEAVSGLEGGERAVGPAAPVRDVESPPAQPRASEPVESPRRTQEEYEAHRKALLRAQRTRPSM